MELNLELTPRSKILLGILGCLFLIVVILQGAPIFYRLFSNQGTKAKQEQLSKTEDLVYAAEVLKPVEFEIYKATGLALAANPQVNPRTQGTATLFDTESPETVIRARIDALVRRAGIQQNYQLLTKPVTAKHTHKLTLQTRENLVRYLYFKHIETEERELTEIIEAETEADTFNFLMDAWLSSADTDETEASSQQSAVGKEPSVSKNKTQSPHAESFREPKAEIQFISLPDAIPLSLRTKLAAFIKTMTMQQLRGATDFRQGFLAAQIQKVTTPRTSGIFGIGTKPATVETRLRKNSTLLNFLTHVLDATYIEAPLDRGELQSALVTYIEKIQEQQETLVNQLALAPATYQTEVYTVEMKFKTDLEKLVNLNHLIETGAKWLIVRDLRISADKQAESGPAARRGRNLEAAGANLNVDIFLIARIF
ncbi:MAG: hypothetical protein OXN25_16725 [Candidatus Poribacteria bacterium]|nr:hypothetical protein [Candidatus Poribacteria bacterium]